MSSILKALKKLEQETLEEQTEPTPAMGLNIRPERNRRKEKTRRTTNKTTPWIWIIFLTLLFIGAGTFVTFFFHGPGTVTPAPPKTAQAPETAPIKTEAKPTPDIAVARQPKPPAPVAQAEPSQLPSPAPHAAPLQRPGSRHQGLSPQLSKAIPPSEPSPPAMGTLDSSPQPPAPKPNQVTGTEISVMEDANLTINAISWSTVPEKRLAVINSILVREGQTVGGFRLVEIEEDQVIVEQSQKKWRVMFRLR